MVELPNTRNKPSKVGHELGCQLQHISNWNSFVRILHHPCDAASLAVMRILYGFLMVIDIAKERGFMRLSAKWGSSTICHFPLFDFLQPLPLKWMFSVYLIMLFGAFGMLLGFRYRFSSFVFLITYWYIFLLDTTAWNNHSYLYGLLGFLLGISDAGQYWSLDSRYKSGACTSVPLWNYILIRAQIFLVYFIAGLKKLDADWIGGYSMRYLSSHWVFFPFRFILTDDQIDYYVVHLFGFFFDLTIGFFMIYKRTRPIAFLFCALFNLMNSQMFNIGMFPYMMLATMPIFCNTDWPKNVLCILSQWIRSEESCPKREKLSTITSKTSPYEDNCCHTDHHVLKKRKTSKLCGKQHCMSVIALVYIFTQIALPYSHFITKGCNHWTDGLYGYSWNMMVHSWQHLHARITVKDKENDRVFYLDPDRWTSRGRWSRYGKLVKQFGRCVQQRFASLGIHKIEIYLDFWVSLNERFQQRMFDPGVNILVAEWSPLQTTTWMKPLLNELSEWRNEIRKKAEYYQSKWPDIVTVFVADFPGLTMDHFIPRDFPNTTIEVLGGEIAVEIPNTGNVTLHTGDSRQLPGGRRYQIHITSSIPALYAYISVNKTEDEVYQLIQSYRCVKSSLEWLHFLL